MIKVLIIAVFTISVIWIFQKIDIQNIDLNKLPPLSTENQNEKITIDIAGAVLKNQKFEVAKFSPLFDVLERAILLSEADQRAFNIYAILEGSGPIYIPYINLQITKVSLNYSTIDELKTLPNIGAVTANNIISYREANEFNILEDIKKVSGIGDGTFDKIKDYIIL